MCHNVPHFLTSILKLKISLKYINWFNYYQFFYNSMSFTHQKVRANKATYTIHPYVADSFYITLLFL